VVDISETKRQAALKEGDTVTGTVRTLMPYGAFVDIGGIDGLLHVSDISHVRVTKPEDVLTLGQELELRILKIDPETKKISLGLKQLQPEPWQTLSLAIGQRISGTVTRLTASSTSRRSPTAKSCATPPTCSNRASVWMPLSWTSSRP
jgi:small subunit ribosomal protein S1